MRISYLPSGTAVPVGRDRRCGMPEKPESRSGFSGRIHWKLNKRRSFCFWQELLCFLILPKHLSVGYRRQPHRRGEAIPGPWRARQSRRFRRCKVRFSRIRLMANARSAPLRLLSPRNICFVGSLFRLASSAAGSASPVSPSRGAFVPRKPSLEGRCRQRRRRGGRWQVEMGSDTLFRKGCPQMKGALVWRML